MDTKRHMEKRNASVAVIGARDFIGAEIAKKFASEGFTVLAGRRNGDKLAPLVEEVRAAGGVLHGRTLDARKEDEVIAFLDEAESFAPLEACIFNIGANVSFPILETTERVFRKVWEMACYSGFLVGREATRHMLPRGRGAIFFTGATAYRDSRPSSSIKARRAGAASPHFQSTRLRSSGVEPGAKLLTMRPLRPEFIKRRAKAWVFASPVVFISSRHVAAASVSGLTPSASSAASSRQSKMASISAS